MATNEELDNRLKVVEKQNNSLINLHQIGGAIIVAAILYYMVREKN